MTKTLLSFIIPVYNVEAYLRECVDSIVSQYVEGCEIILVDDGSTDASGSICDELAAEKEYITVIHQENCGVAIARNKGLQIAAGEYISFVDSDDRINAESVAEIINWIQADGADICFLDGHKFYPNGRQEPLGDGILKAELENKTKLDVMKYLATRSKFAGSPCTKIYRKKFLSDNQLLFPLDGRRCEDLGFCRDCFLKAVTFDALEIPFYEYRQNRPGSFTETVTDKSFYYMGLFVEESAQMLTKGQKPVDQLASFAMSFAAYEYCIMLWQYSRLPEGEKKNAMAFLREYAWVLQFGRSRKTKTIRMVQQVLGIRNAARLLDCYMKLREKKTQ